MVQQADIMVAYIRRSIGGAAKFTDMEKSGERSLLTFKIKLQYETKYKFSQNLVISVIMLYNVKRLLHDQKK